MISTIYLQSGLRRVASLQLQRYYFRPKCDSKRFCTVPSNLPLLTLYTKDPCPLCDDALETLAPHLDQVKLEKVDITKPENRKWWKEYKYDIPVFHLNGTFLMKHKGDTQILINALKEISEGPS